MVNCSYCGADNPRNAKFCLKCGKPIVASESSGISGVKPVPQARIVTPIAGRQLTAPRTIPSIGMCFYHPNLRANYICNRCGRQICNDCAKPHGDMVFCPQCYLGVASLMPTPVTAPTSQPEVAAGPSTATPRSIVGTLLAVFGGLIILFGAAVIGMNAFPTWVTFVQTWWTGVSLETLRVDLTVLGVLSGILVLLGAAIMYQRNYEKAGAALVVAFAAVSLVVMGGFFAGFILGIVGAILGTLKR